jgi:hypothetical protein
VALTTDQKGAVAEAFIAAVAVRAGIPVLRPLNDGLRYDLVFDVFDRFVRVQCKWAATRGDVVVVTLRSCRRGPGGFVRRLYAAADVDLVAAYCDDVRRSFAIPPQLFDGRTSVQLRLAPARNNQRVGIKWADDFDLERLDWSALAGP